MSAESLVRAYLRVRRRTERLAAPLSPEDQLLQAMPEASPVKWHRGHTTWFFETFLLAPRGTPAYEPRWGLLFNSYYEAVGPRHARPQRGLLSRPSSEEVGRWRQHVDERVLDLLQTPAGRDTGCQALVRLGLAHEEQHQELMLTDVLAAFALNPLRPAYVEVEAPAAPPEVPLEWLPHEGGMVSLGASAEAPFAFDNEGPRHQVFLQPFALANRLVTVGEWAAFSADGGYETPSLWLSEGLDWVRRNGVTGPGYAEREGAAVKVYGLAGVRAAHAHEPVLHLSYYEADALATWLGARLPTEAEWEAMAQTAPAPAADQNQDPPLPSGVPPLPGNAARVMQLYDTAWQWTRSSYAAYPGFRPAAGAIGEYNGKFMVNQQVLRGGSVFTPPGHTRATYRNFWHPHTQFQASGLRLARDV